MEQTFSIKSSSTSSFSKKTLHRFWVSILLNFYKTLSIFFHAKLCLCSPLSWVSTIWLWVQLKSTQGLIEEEQDFQRWQKNCKSGQIKSPTEVSHWNDQSKRHLSNPKFDRCACIFLIFIFLFFSHFIPACRGVKMEMAQKCVWLTCHRGWFWHVKFPAFSWQ